MEDKILHVLKKYVTPEQAEKLKAQGIITIPHLRAASDDVLRGAGLTTAASRNALRTKLVPKVRGKK